MTATAPLMPKPAEADASIRISRVEASAYTIPTDEPESDGTLEWDSTTLVLAEVEAAGTTGIGYTYTHSAAVAVINDALSGAVVGLDPMDTQGANAEMVRVVRNWGRPGICATAIAAVDNAIWDLKCRLLHVSLSSLLGNAKDSVPIYGSGGFTSYSVEKLQCQLAGWVEAGIPRVKMKVGRDPDADPKRVRAAREAIGTDADLFVDANGVHRPTEALKRAENYTASNVIWFEEPVSPDDLPGLRFVRERSPPGMDIADGEYGYGLAYFRSVLQAGAVDVIQADATRCCGITGFLEVAALCRAYDMPLSAHCAPALHAAVCGALDVVIHLEYFHDHVRIESMLFDGVSEPAGGSIVSNTRDPGLGLEFKRGDAERYRAA